MSLCVWIILFLLGVSDAREYRIPNKGVLVLFFFSVIALFLKNYSEGGILLLPHIIGFFISFVVGIIFYALGSMAAGDVKLLSVIGFILGVSQLLLFFQYLFFVTVFVGSMYWFLNRLSISKQSHRNSSVIGAYDFASYISKISHQVKKDFVSRRNITYMPFAPVIIISVAMQQYFQY